MSDQVFFIRGSAKTKRNQIYVLYNYEESNSRSLDARPCQLSPSRRPSAADRQREAIREAVQEGWYDSYEIDAQENVRFVRTTCHR